MKSEYKKLTKTESNKLWEIVFEQYNERALDILKGQKNEKLKRQLVSLQHMFQLFNADFNSVLEEVQKFINNGDFIGLEKRVLEIKKSLNKHKTVLNEQIKEGMELRIQEKPKYPDIFDDSSRVFISVPKMNTAIQDSRELFENIKEAFEGEYFDINLSEAETSYVVEYSNQKEKSHSFLSRRLELLNYVNGVKNININDLFNLLSMTYSEVKQIMWQRQKSGDKTNAELRKVLYDKVIFNHAKLLLKKKLEYSPYAGEQDIFKNILWFMIQSYKNVLSSMEKSSAKKYNPRLFVDTLVFSKDPVDIATLSTYVDWENNCLYAGESNFLTHIRYEIGLGTMVINAIDSKNPFKKIAQIVLNLYKNPQNGKILYIPRNTYGAYLPELRPLVDKILKEQINTEKAKNNSIFLLDNRIYRDGGPGNLIFADDFFKALNLLQIPYKKEEGKLKFQGAWIDLTGTGLWLKELPDNIINARLILSGSNSLQKLSNGLDLIHLRIQNNSRIKELPSDIKVNSIFLENTKITNFPDDLSVRELTLKNQRNIKNISNINIKKLRWLNLDNTGISELPEEMNLESLSVIKNVSIVALPKKIKISNNMDVRDSVISELPNGLKLSGWMDISNSKVTRIPDDTKVETLYIGSLDQISALPPGVKKVKVSDKKETEIEESKIKEWRANYRREHKEKLQEAKKNLEVKIKKIQNTKIRNNIEKTK